MRQYIFIAITLCLQQKNFAQQVSVLSDSLKNSSSYFLKVHFLYGSRPAKKFKQEESKWFGGILGGHVGVEKDSGKIFNFVPSGKFHVFSHKKKRHSKFTFHSNSSFYSILGGNDDSVKKLCVEIPITKTQAEKFDSLTKLYTAQTPFDYAFIGMRCGAAAYYVLAQLGIVKKFGQRRTFLKIFYPKKLRKRLLKKAGKNNWHFVRQDGSKRRIWEKD